MNYVLLPGFTHPWVPLQESGTHGLEFLKRPLQEIPKSFEAHFFILKISTYDFNAGNVVLNSIKKNFVHQLYPTEYRLMFIGDIVIKDIWRSDYEDGLITVAIVEVSTDSRTNPEAFRGHGVSVEYRIISGGLN